MNRLELRCDLGLIESNARIIRSKIESTVKILAVVKDDAYGHGSVQVAKRLEEKKLCDYFAVATAKEGRILRKAGIQTDILILGYTDSDSMTSAVFNDLSVTVYSLDSLLTLEHVSKETGKCAKAHLKIETGMNRIGISAGEELNELLAVWKDLTHVKMAGVFSHFSSADNNTEYTDRQFTVFKAACSLIQDAGFAPLRHIAASSAMFDKRYQLDMVRAGIALYGVGDESTKTELKPAQTLISHPVRLFSIDKGEKVGYSLTYTAPRKTIVMTVPCGYGDGYPRILSNRASVLVNGKRAPIIGNICMDMLMCDVTEAGEIEKDTPIVLLGEQGNQTITPMELAELSQTIPYEIMLGFSGRVERTWVE